ncbi:MULTISPECIES: hypothetical protein [unclassified Microcoleus]|uniref:hypothetical protein n=1 Tax=unclassified Microcoleus TaxID=2642155 RepID=UPI002FD27BE4
MTVIAIDRLQSANFGISDTIGRHCKWRDGVFIYKNSDGEMYFQCELPLCQNGDRIEIGSLYNTSVGIVQVLAMNLTSHVNQAFIYIVLDENGDRTETLHGDEFISIFW